MQQSKSSQTQRQEIRHVALNAASSGALVAALCFELKPAGEPPATITLIPAPDADGWIRGEDGRKWRMPDAAAIVKAFNRRRAITENHAGQLAAPQGGASPAFAWIERIRADNGAIVGDLTWTPRGKAAYEAKDYGFFSPEFIYAKNSLEIEELIGASLTNDPNFTQLALNARNHQEQPPMLKAIAVALGLAETADEAACVAAVNALKSEKQTALNAAATPDATKFVPMAQHSVALNRATTAEAELKKLKDAGVEAEITAAVDGALAAGKIVPATKDYYLGMCRTEGGLENFKKFVAAQPVIAEPTKTDKKPGEGASGEEGLTPGQLAICRASGLDPKAYAASLKAQQ